MKSNNEIRIEALLLKLDIARKTGIKLPIREEDFLREKEQLEEVKNKNLISEKTFNEIIKEQESRALNNELYKEFYECLKLKIGE